ncbi:MAG TPA: SIP domain-containing protein [Microbacteriaceae bacterium]|nr:SIP domain-containing protein [Microbacteriaceae bacterium]
MHGHLFDDEASRVLIAGCAADLPAIQRILRELPTMAYGQVYIEIASPVQARRWPVPDGVIVTWLRRDLQEQESGAALPKGELLARAVSAWMSEWLPADDPVVPGFVWLGGATSPRVDELYETLSRRLDPMQPEPAGSED